MAEPSGLGGHYAKEGSGRSKNAVLVVSVLAIALVLGGCFEPVRVRVWVTNTGSEVFEGFVNLTYHNTSNDWITASRSIELGPQDSETLVFGGVARDRVIVTVFNGATHEAADYHSKNALREAYRRELSVDVSNDGITFSIPKS